MNALEFKKELRLEAKKINLTFKNNELYYRGTNENIGLTFNSLAEMYENFLSGYIATQFKKNG